MSDLDTLRHQIDTCDDEIIELLAKRFGLVNEVKRIKDELSLPPYDATRWQNIRDKIAEQAEKNGLNPSGTQAIYEEIHNYALKYIYED